MTDDQLSLVVDQEVEPEYIVLDVKDLPPNKDLVGPEPDANFKKSVRDHGVLIPILVERKGEKKYTVRAGVRRIKAVRAVRGRKTLPAQVYPEGSTFAGMSLTENLARSANPAIEYQSVMGLAKKLKMGPEDIGKALGLKVARVRKLMTLAGLTVTLTKAFNAGTLKETSAFVLAKLPKKIQNQAAREFVEAGDKISVGRVKELAREEVQEQIVSMPGEAFETPAAEDGWEPNWPISVGSRTFMSTGDLLGRLDMRRLAADADGAACWVVFEVASIRVEEDTQSKEKDEEEEPF